jgi:hypothetical protein
MTLLRRTSLGLPLALAVLAGCSDLGSITETVPVDPALTIAHAGSGFKAGFYFLSPLVKEPGYSGTFDADLSPEVRICEVSGSACGAHLTTFTTTTGPGSETVRLGTDHYIVNWHTDQFNLATDKLYRISVRVNGVLLGYTDVQPVSSGKQISNIDTREAVALVNGRTLPVKFRIETGIVAGVSISPTHATIPLGHTQQFTATVTDLHGNTLNTAVAWTSSAEGVATVNGSGLATGAGAGTATITATTDHESASATLTVLPLGLVAEYHHMTTACFAFPSCAFPNGAIVGSRIESTINHNQGSLPFPQGSLWPEIGLDSDLVSVRWSGFVTPLYSETYTFCVTTDDGTRLWINDVLVVNSWIPQSTTERCGTIALAAGQMNLLRMEWFENFGNAVAELRWQSASQAKQIIPASALSHTPTVVGVETIPGVRAKYFHGFACGSGLCGTFVRSRVESTIDHDAGDSSSFWPGVVNVNDFEVQWTGFVTPLYSQSYTFCARTDDGVKLWINGNLVVDAWVYTAAINRCTAPIPLVAGQKYSLRMEYFEAGGAAVAELRWVSASQAYQIIPVSALSVLK